MSLHLTLLQTTAPAPSMDIFQLLMKGGVVMIPLAFISVVAIILIFERMMYYSKNLKADDKVFMQFVDLMRAGKKNDAANLCSKQNNSWGRIFMYATMSEKNDPNEVDKLLEDAANVEIAHLEKSLNYLSIIAGVAPLLGFIGTIAGVITIFFDISTSSDISISSISEGLYKKMVSSASGLVIGIIAFMGYHLFINQVDGFSAKIQEQALKLKVSLQNAKNQ